MASGLCVILRPSAGAFVTSQGGGVGHCAREKKANWGREALPASSAYTADEPSALESGHSHCPELLHPDQFQLHPGAPHLATPSVLRSPAALATAGSS